MSFAASRGVDSSSSGGGGDFSTGGDFDSGSTQSDWVPEDDFFFQRDWEFAMDSPAAPEQQEAPQSFDDFLLPDRDTSPAATPTAATPEPAPPEAPSSFDDLLLPEQAGAPEAEAVPEVEAEAEAEAEAQAEAWIPPTSGPLADMTFSQAQQAFPALEAEWNDPNISPGRKAYLALLFEPETVSDILDDFSELTAENEEVWVPASAEDQVFLLQGIAVLEGTGQPEIVQQAEQMKYALADKIPQEMWDAVGVERPDTSKDVGDHIMSGIGYLFGKADELSGGTIGTALEWADKPSQYVLRAIAASGRDAETGEDLGNGLGDTLTGVGQGLRALFTGDDGGVMEFADQDGDGSLNFREAIGADPEAGGRWAGFLDTLGVVATDPATYLTFGTKAAARVGLDAVEATFGKETADQVRRVGMRNALDESQQVLLFEALQRQADQAIAAGSRRTAKAGAAETATRNFDALRWGGSQAPRIGNIQIAPSLGRVSQPLREVVDTTPALAAARSKINTARNYVSPRNRVRQVLGSFKERQLYRARTLADADAATNIDTMSTRINGTRDAALKRRGARRAEISELELDRLTRAALTDMDTMTEAIRTASREGRPRTARYLTTLKEYAQLAAMPDEILEYVDTIHQITPQLDDAGRQAAIDELMARYPLTRRTYEDILDRDYWIPGMGQEAWEREFREAGVLEDFLDNADDIRVTSIDGERIPVSEAWHTGRLSPEDYIRFRNEVRSEYRTRPEFRAALDGADPVNLPPGLRGSPGVDQAQETFSQLDLLQYGKDLKAYNQSRWGRDGGGAAAGGARRPVQPLPLEKQTDNLPPEDLVGGPTSRVVEEWTEEVPSEVATEAALRRAQDAVPPIAERTRTLDPAQPRVLQVEDALAPENRPDPLRVRELTDQGKQLRSYLEGRGEWVDFNNEGTLEYLNEVARTRFSHLGIDDDIFLDDPLKALAVQGKRQYKAAAEQQFINTLVEEGLIAPVAELADDVTDPALRAAQIGPPENMPNAVIPDDVRFLGRKYWVTDPRIVDDLRKTDLMFNKSEELEAFGKFMDRRSATWASWATGALPNLSFHVRNSYGNWYLNYIKGVRNPKVYTEAMEVQLVAARVSRRMKEGLSMEDALADVASQGGKRTERLTRLFKSANDEGIIDSSYFDELGNFDSNELYDDSLFKGKLLGRNNLLVRGGQALGSTVEHNARLAHFISKLDELGDVRAASLSVKETLFDYNDLTRFERTKLRTISRFYTFMRKNLGVHLGVLARHPGQLLNATRLTDAILADDDGNVSNLGLPDWQQEAGYLQGSEDSILNDILSLGGAWDTGLDEASLRVDLPLTSAVEMFNPLFSAMNVIPGLKDVMPGEANARDLSSSILGLTSGPAVEAVTLLFEYNSGKDMFTGGDMPTGTEQVLMSLADAVAPIWSRYDRWAGQATANEGLGPLGNNTASREDTQKSHALLSTIAGLSVYGRTTEDDPNEAVLRGYIAQYRQLVEEFKEDGIDLPSASELESIGIIPTVNILPEEGFRPRTDSLDAQKERIDTMRELGYEVPDSEIAEYEAAVRERDTYTPTSEVRLWARRNGFEVTTSGRIPYEVQYAFNQENEDRPYLDPFADLVRFSEDDERPSILD